MIELKTCYSFSQVPYITYNALEEYATEVLRDFSRKHAPELLLTPTPVNVDCFLEYYLRLTVDVRQLCYNKKVLGMTAFNDGMVEIMDEDTGLIEKLPVTAGTVIIDSSLETKRNERRRRFTMTHEGCHWLIHRKAFAEDNPFGPAGIYENQYLAAKEGRVDYSRSQKERTDIEHMERQADFLASAILMPKNTLRMAFVDFFKFYDEKPRQLVRGTSYLEDCYAKQLPEYIAKVFNVSIRAATIRLEKLTAIVNKGWGYRHG
jgi:Zn-dependent peptidase ImmA (M78 family)